MARRTHYAKQVAGLNIVSASQLHFQMDETNFPSDRVTDVVEGAWCPYTGSTQFEQQLPFSVFQVDGGKAPDIYGRSKSKKVYNSGYIVMYSMGMWNVSAIRGALLNLLDSGATTNNEPVFFVEEQIDGASRQFNGLIGETLDLTTNTTVRLGWIDGDIDDNQYLPSDQVGGFSYCLVVPLDGVNTPKLYTHDGNTITFDKAAGLGSSGVYAINSWDMSGPMTMGFVQVDGNILGMLHFDSYIPTPEDAFNCAKHHHKYAPRGIKDVWSGWKDKR